MKYYIIAGERSGDLHGGNLVKAIRKYDTEATLRGFGGDDMQAAGMEVVVHYREMAFMGFVSLISNLTKIFEFLSRCKADILEYNPDAVVLIDYGGFNLRIAKFAKAHGFKVYYYIPPKVWAWNQSRAWKLKANVDCVFSILPFELEFYKRFELQAEYVGNPVLDAIKSYQPDTGFLERHNLSKERKLVALLPGSRKIELARIVPLMAKVADENNQVQFVVAAVNNLSQELYQPLKNKVNVTFVEGETYHLLNHADAAIVTSGTATLETALFKVPQVVVYKTGGLEYLIAKSLVKVKFISLVNLIAGKEVVKEMIQHSAQENSVNAELQKLLLDNSYLNAMKSEYNKLYELLDTGSASDNTARLITQYLKK